MSYVKNRAEIISEMLETHGYIFCQVCEVSNAFQFHTHHIYFRSEKPNHPMLNHKLNLIICCLSCHDKFHGDKSVRDELVSERKLDELFDG